MSMTNRGATTTSWSEETGLIWWSNVDHFDVITPLAARVNDSLLPPQWRPLQNLRCRA